MGKGETKLGEESKEKTKAKTKKKDILPTKVVVRRLPPSLTEDQFKEELGPLPEHDYLRFEGPDYSLGPIGFSRVYINFKNFTDLFQFQNKYDGYIFIDSKGKEYSAVIETALYQRIPKLSKKRKDIKCGTIDKDPDYLMFIEDLGKEEEPVSSVQLNLEQMEAAKSDPNARSDKKTTPLIEFLKAKRAARLSARGHAGGDKRGSKDNRDYDKESKSGKRESKLSDGRANDKKGNDKRGKEGKKKEEASGKKVSPSKDKGSKDQREGKESKEGKQSKASQKKSKDKSKTVDSDKQSRPSSARNEVQRGKEKEKDKERDRMKEEGRDSKKPTKEPGLGSPEKSHRGYPSRADEQKPRRGSIEFEDPCIVAFGKALTSTEESKQDKREAIDEKGSSSRVRNKDRPTMAIYRPPLRFSTSSGKGREHKTSPEKGSHTDRDQASIEKSSSKEKLRPPSARERDRESNKERDYRNRDRERDRYRNRDRDREQERERERDWEKDRDRGKDRDYSVDKEAERERGKRRDERDRNRYKNDKDKDKGRGTPREREKDAKLSKESTREEEKGVYVTASASRDIKSIEDS